MHLSRPVNMHPCVCVCVCVRVRARATIQYTKNALVRVKGDFITQNNYFSKVETSIIFKKQIIIHVIFKIVALYSTESKKQLD